MKPTQTQLLDRAVALCHERATTLANPSICLACGNEQGDCEPDARNYKCDECGKLEVFGAEEALFMLA